MNRITMHEMRNKMNAAVPRPFSLAHIYVRTHTHICTATNPFDFYTQSHKSNDDKKREQNKCIQKRPREYCFITP